MNKEFESYLLSTLNSFRKDTIRDAMMYSMEGGKRFRPELIFSVVKGAGLPECNAYPAAAALEYIQTYSLIHDDLPAMDNDDLRRGKPSLHKAFREDIAILAGDSLLNHSFGIIADSDYDAETKVRLISDLSSYAGMNGMIRGQLLDVTADSSSLDEEMLFEIQDNKTGGLFKFCMLAAMHICGFEDRQYFLDLGSLIGIIFQNQDDLFDIIKSEKESGKSNSDLRNDKLTALKFYSVDELKERISSQFDELYRMLEKAPFDTQFLKEITEKIRNR